MANISLFDPMAAPMNRFLREWLPRDWPFEKGSYDMRVDLSEDDKSYVVRADLPGANKDDIRVDIDGSHISINAQMRSYKEEKEGENIVHSERYEGNVFRSFNLPSEVDEASAVASYKDGVLELRLPKRTDTKAKRLTIN
jgi:HSP20 family protein